MIIIDTGVVNGIYNVATLIPAIGMVLLSLSLIFFYPLSKKKVEEHRSTQKAQKRLIINPATHALVCEALRVRKIFLTVDKKEEWRNNNSVL